jgi:predicted ArsR family transcriptional regulator
MVRDRVTVQEAARRLGVKDDAIRKRIQRGSLEYDKGEDGRVYVYLEPSSAVSGDARGGEAAQDASYDALLVGLQDQVSYLRSVLREERDARRRADTIIAQLTRANAALAQRVPELQAPRRRDGTARETEGEDPAGEDPAGVHEVDGTGEPRGPVRPRDTAEFPVRASLTRPWWRRAFGG